MGWYRSSARESEVAWQTASPRWGTLQRPQASIRTRGPSPCSRWHGPGDGTRRRDGRFYVAVLRRRRAASLPGESADVRYPCSACPGGGLIALRYPPQWLPDRTVQLLLVHASRLTPGSGMHRLPAGGWAGSISPCRPQSSVPTPQRASLMTGRSRCTDPTLPSIASGGAAPRTWRPPADPQLEDVPVHLLVDRGGRGRPRQGSRADAVLRRASSAPSAAI
jgi:hypothetical protein